MAVSTLSRGSIPHHNKFSTRAGHTPQGLIVHHWGGTSGGDARLAQPHVQVSTNYVIYGDGVLKVQVPEEYRAWTSGNQAADQRNITVEVQNSSGAPEWRVSDAAFNTLCALVADLAARYRWGAVTRSRLSGHRDHYPTECPGGFLYSRLGEVAARAEALRSGRAGSKPAAVSNIVEEDEDEMKTAGFYYLSNGKTINVIVNPVSGFFHEYEANDGGYNSPVAATFGTGSFAKISESHARKLELDARKVRLGEK
ncbi:peptidoglycan recognition family protein [Leucobacter sp. OH1287]|uniref:peptidoglycan recognition protein family protein n=1 Tax=Leucobacter sp. OH1287 TaxID=2491049 RepID=UPI000F5F1066|nr:peptidoglycan recognition family protein [Leucobacter sp. OH1287]RRD61617.1 N-acetylmuramoyl-L-alanine amidase [Leucobacter sp. OH1287]